MKKYFYSVLLLIISNSIFGQTLYEVDNKEKERRSSLVVEGKVVDQVSFWDPAHTMIYTANKIKVYKVFKGELRADYVEVLTIGGTVGFENITASDLLELNKGETGVLFCYPNSTNLRSATGDILFDVYASSQGFIKYNVQDNKAADPFNSYSSITGELYPFLKKLTGANYLIKDPSLNISDNQNTANRTSVVVTSFSPTTVNAGATSDPGTNVLTITGTGFGARTGSAAVRFQDANSGVGSANFFTVDHTSSLIISWTDTEIQIRVPGRAGTGTIKVRDATGLESTSFDRLEVFYSIIDVTLGGMTKQSNLINANGQGGYTMLYSTNLTPADSLTFTRALNTWRDLSGFNVIDGGPTTIQKTASDGQCVVFLDNLENGAPLADGVLAVCYTYTNACSASSSFRRTEFDIIIRSSYSTGSTSFAQGPCPPPTNAIDLETVLLHELGHAINLGHINDAPEGSNSARNPQKLMYFAVSNGVKRTSPDASAYQGSIYMCATNTSINLGTCSPVVTSHVQTPIIRDSKDECPLAFPNTTTQQGAEILFDLEHATSNKSTDPQYTNVLCTNVGTNITNNLYHVFRTDGNGSLMITVSDFTLVPASAASCLAPPTARIALYQVNSCPDGQLFPPPVACLNFSGNGPLSTINGLTANTSYLMYVDGRVNTKASFKLTLGGTALPIRLERFAGEIKGAINELKWKIASLSDVNKINLEKSANGRDFTYIKEYNGSIDLNKEYIFNDSKPFAGSNYYRLATYNKDGSVQYSNVVLLKRTDKIKFNIYPNPVVRNINVSVTSIENLGAIQLKIYNSVGQLLFVRSSSVSAGKTNIEVKTDNIAAGSYRLVVTGKNNAILESANFQKL